MSRAGTHGEGQPPVANQFFRSQSLWGEMRLRTPPFNELPSPQPPRWTRTSSAPSTRGSTVETPSPRRETESDVTPPRPENSGLPRLLRASMGPPEIPPSDDRAATSGEKRSAAALTGSDSPRPLSAPPRNRLLASSLPGWASATPESRHQQKAAAATEPAASTGASTASPGRRLRTKTPPVSPAADVSSTAVVSPPPFKLAGGPASSLGNLIERVAATSTQYAPPLKKPRTARWMAEQRGTAMMEVPIEALEKADLARTAASDENAPPRRWPKRIRIPRLEFWRNERVIYERAPGSLTPAIARVSMNFAPRAENMGERKFPSEVVQQAVPVLVEDQPLEFVSAKTECITSKLIVLPPAAGRANPPTYVVPAGSRGQVSLLEGSLRCGYEGEEDKARLQTGDHMLLPGGDREVLLASAGHGSSSTGAKFKIFFVSGDSTDDDNVLPLGH